MGWFSKLGRALDPTIKGSIGNKLAGAIPLVGNTVQGAAEVVGQVGTMTGLSGGLGNLKGSKPAVTPQPIGTGVTAPAQDVTVGPGASPPVPGALAPSSLWGKFATGGGGIAVAVVGVLALLFLLLRPRRA